MRDDIISKIYYNRESEEYGMYKVLGFVEKRNGVDYYSIKFKNSGNQKVVSITQILKNSVKDLEAKKKQTKAKNREKKKAKKERKEWVTKYLHNPKNICVLDLASESTGIAIIQDKKIIYNDYFYIAKNKDDPNDLLVRLNFMKTKCIESMEKYNVDSVVIESLPFKGSKHVLFVLAQIRILILDYCYENNLQWISVYPQAWENYIWKGRFKDKDTKDRTLDSLKADFGIDFREKFKGKNDNEVKKKVYEDCSDVFGLAQYVINKRCKYSRE